MGLITGILTLPLAPVRGVAWLAEQIQEQAEEQMYSPAAIRNALAELEMQRELGQIDEEEAERLEEDLLERLMHGPSAGSGEEWHG